MSKGQFDNAPTVGALNIGEARRAARSAALVYATDAQPGIQRLRRGRSFRYTSPRNTVVRDSATLSRIKTLAIPPAWTKVWIATKPNAHLQATGRDARGRKQYRYHARWRTVRDGNKFGRMALFGKALPTIRRAVARELRLPLSSRQRVLATIVSLLENTLIRVGNEEYSRENGSFGLTTLKNRHAEMRGETIHFGFRGKGGKIHAIELHDARLARAVRRCQDLPGGELFCYLDDRGKAHDITSSVVNAYLRDISGEDFTAKDFRTWAATLLAAQFLAQCEHWASLAKSKRTVVQALETVAERLGNTPAVCRKSYVFPAVIDAYCEGALAQHFGGNGKPAKNGRTPTIVASSARRRGFSAAEKSLLGLLKKRAIR